MIRAALFALLLALAGCASVQVGTGTRVVSPGAGADPDQTWQLHANVWGYYFFAKLPLATGSTDNVGMWTFFTDTVNAEAITRLLGDAAEALGADELRNVDVKVYSGWFMGPFWIAEAWGSATAVARPDVHAIPPLEPPSRRATSAAAAPAARPAGSKG